MKDVKTIINEEALRRFPKPLEVRRVAEYNKEHRETFIEAATFGYNIKESVDEQMLDALKRINDCSLSKQQRESMIENAIISASQNTVINEGDRCDCIYTLKYNDASSNLICGRCNEVINPLKKNSMFNKESYLLGLTDAIELIGDEFDCCKLEFSDDNKINTMHSALSRVISLIEDRMIQHGSDITMNQFVSEFNKSLTLKEK